tara:strand:- start:13983 stop:14537 length:555 start_codon:yes stop_codon:yes gene_type:complete
MCERLLTVGSVDTGYDLKMHRIEFWRDIHTKLGDFRLALDSEGGLHTGWKRIGYCPSGGTLVPTLREDIAMWTQAYMEGRRTPLPPFDIPRTTPFRTRCLKACRRLSPGNTISYGQLAMRAGRPSAARAAGSAMRNNMTPLLVPCHRVIRSNGELGGFAGRTAHDDPAIVLKSRLQELEALTDV